MTEMMGYGLNLSGTDLSGADLTGTKLPMAILADCVVDIATIWPVRHTPPAGEAPVT